MPPPLKLLLLLPGTAEAVAAELTLLLFVPGLRTMLTEEDLEVFSEDTES